MATSSSASKASHAQGRGIKLLSNLCNSIRRSTAPTGTIPKSTSTISSDNNTIEESSGSSIARPLTQDETNAVESEYLHIIDKELRRYEYDDIIDITEGLDLLQFWDVSDIAFIFGFIT